MTPRVVRLLLCAPLHGELLTTNCAPDEFDSRCICSLVLATSCGALFLGGDGTDVTRRVSALGNVGFGRASLRARRPFTSYVTHRHRILQPGRILPAPRVQCGLECVGDHDGLRWLMSPPNCGLNHFSTAAWQSGGIAPRTPADRWFNGSICA
ncbi:hypothetical protein L227DRAFT_254557 [Lentinus tigrinus ALCF2SS1-6]|uniref:Secreted protein n=1 Tax=Lentinus tigrinus ALCF2SS1-6 TaxID=1328759 RepID=A0A5C2RZT1_9APHY|nr:hypothetical protein L227DRAFT_254557 [Lentinus tigrinus ALCF2SS1-6]